MPDIEEKFSNTVVFTDFHGDIDTMARSITVKGLMKYDGDEENLLSIINRQMETQPKATFNSELEALIITQNQPVRFIFLGDALDRYKYGFYLLHFFQKIRWENFNIYPVFLMGNHDLLNLMFLVNPFRMHQVYKGQGPGYSKTMEYLRSMRIDSGLVGFMELHREELAELQKRFYKSRRLNFSFDHFNISLKYSKNFSFLNQIMVSDIEEPRQYVDRLRAEMKLTDDEKRSYYSDFNLTQEVLAQFYKYLETGNQGRQTNWWDIQPRGLKDKDDSGHGLYYGSLREVNLIRRPIDVDQEEIIPLDWRLISMMFRRHYGEYFRNSRYVFFEKGTLYAHGGISPLALVDPLVFGNLYDPIAQKFRPPERQMDLPIMVDRCNRVVSQVINNTLNDVSFSDMSGSEIIDRMGWWRGCHSGFPVFGGPVWCDFENLRFKFNDHRPPQHLLDLYDQFCKTYGIKRIVCGHTPFYSYGEVGPMWKQLKELSDIVEYICIDNGCSRAYRHEKPVPNGIKIDAEGNILDEPDQMKNDR